MPAVKTSVTEPSDRCHRKEGIAMESPTTSATTEFAVDMTCNGCVKSVKKALGGVNGINSVQVNLDTQQVIIDSTLPSNTLKNLIESTGKTAVLQGYGALNKPHLGAAVAEMLVGNEKVKGVVRLVQTDESNCVIDGAIDGLPPGQHKLYIHECGDISDGCRSCGDVFGWSDLPGQKPVGDVCTFTTSKDGRSEFRLTNQRLKVWDLIGRSMIVHKNVGLQDNYKPHLENRAVCGIIARSSGLFQNTKKICACDGVTLWEERNVPIAGPGRKAKI